MLGRVCVNMLRTSPSSVMPYSSLSYYRMQSTDAGHMMGAFSKRERAAEESYAAKREAEALKRLTERLRANQVDEETIRNIQQDIQSAKAPSDPAVSLAELLQFRKDIVKEIRDLEDTVADMKYQLQQLQKKVDLEIYLNK